jgi:hypothetical protein
VGIVLAGLLLSDLMNFLSQFWGAVLTFAFLVSALLPSAAGRAGNELPVRYRDPAGGRRGAWRWTQCFRRRERRHRVRSRWASMAFGMPVRAGATLRGYPCTSGGILNQTYGARIQWPRLKRTFRRAVQRGDENAWRG